MSVYLIWWVASVCSFIVCADVSRREYLVRMHRSCIFDYNSSIRIMFHFEVFFIVFDEYEEKLVGKYCVINILYVR